MSNKKKVKISLRFQIALGVVFPMLVGMVFLSALHLKREQQLLDEQTLQTTIQIGEVISGSLRYSMLLNNHEMLDSTLDNIITVDTVSRIQIIDSKGVIRVDSKGLSIGEVHPLTESGCVECHQYEAAQRPRAVLLSFSPNTLRIASPILNSEECMSCHDASLPQLGVLFVDAPLRGLEEHIVEDLKVEIIILVLATFSGGLTLYFLLNWLVVKRVEIFSHYLETYADGDFSVRMPEPRYEKDELDQLVFAVNDMAKELEQRTEIEHRHQQLQQSAVREERERIARELHDGMAQLSGFVRAKASAIRLLLKTGKMENAILNLTQLEEAAQHLSIDVREAILNLRTSGQIGSGLAAMLQDYVEQFRKLSELTVMVSIPFDVEDIPFLAETELHILRIVQEALSNARKHAKATTVSLTVTKENNYLLLSVEDDGIGFIPEDICDGNDKSLHFGLCGMRDRAEAIGGTFAIESELGTGTQVLIKLPLSHEEVN